MKPHLHAVMHARHGSGSTTPSHLAPEGTGTKAPPWGLNHYVRNRWLLKRLPAAQLRRLLGLAFDRIQQLSATSPPPQPAQPPHPKTIRW